jgi:hypothetical protein
MRREMEVAATRRGCVHPILARDAEARLQAHLRYLRRLAGARLARDDDDGMGANGGHDVVLAGGDGKVRGIGGQGDMCGAQVSQLCGGPCLGQQAVKDRVVPPLMPVVAQETDEPGSNADPVPQEASGQQAPEFMHARVVHPA